MRHIVARPVLVHDARDMAQILLSTLPDRWRHTIAVARRAEDVAHTVRADDAEILIAAAWLHDVGYADELVDTGLHSVDAARFLDRHRWPVRLNALVAHHSGANFVAQERGLTDALSAYSREESAVSDALAYADQTTGPRGERLTVSQRLAESQRRHGPDSPQARVHHVRGPYLLAAARRVEQRLRSLR